MADYVIVMGYDENYAAGGGGGGGGRNCFLPISYVKEGIENTLKEVPKEKVINVLPFYKQGNGTVMTERPHIKAYGIKGCEAVGQGQYLEIDWV